MMKYLALIFLLVQTAFSLNYEFAARTTVTASRNFNGVGSKAFIRVLSRGQVVGAGEKMDNPIIVIEGMDPLYYSHRFNWEAFENTINQGRFAQNLLDRGYDIVLVRFDDPNNWIQANAFALLDVYNWVWNRSTGTHPIVTMGISAGALSARYSLQYANAHGIDTHTGLYISYDGPHNGAEIPQSLQGAAVYWGYKLVKDAKDFQKVLKSPVAQQLLYSYTPYLLNHYSSGLSELTNRISTYKLNEHAQFLSTIHDPAFPMPAGIRKIAFSNGDGKQRPVPLPASAQQGDVSFYMEIFVDYGFLPFMKLRYSKPGSDVTVFNADYDLLGFGQSELTFKWREPAFIEGVPGSQMPFYDLATSSLGNLDIGSPEIHVNLAHNHTFVPVTSALSLDYNVDSPATYEIDLTALPAPDLLTHTKFDALYYLNRATGSGSDLNVLHVELPPEHRTELLREILAASPPSGNHLPGPITMVRLPGGSFLMGYPDDVALNLTFRPRHTVQLSPFYIDKTEVTQQEYLALMGINPSHYQVANGFPGSSLVRPVENVSWFDAVLFANARSKSEGRDTVYVYTAILRDLSGKMTGLENLNINYSIKGYRLPTEAEWEYSYLGGTDCPDYWGDRYGTGYLSCTGDDAFPASQNAWWGGDPVCNFGSGVCETHPVAQKLKNDFNLWDMAGNVSEWVNDWWGDYYSVSPLNDPTGPTTGTYKAKRGGDYGATLFSIQGPFRTWLEPYQMNLKTGFRCVLPE